MCSERRRRFNDAAREEGGRKRRGRYMNRPVVVGEETGAREVPPTIDQDNGRVAPREGSTDNVVGRSNIQNKKKSLPLSETYLPRTPGEEEEEWRPGVRRTSISARRTTVSLTQKPRASTCVSTRCASEAYT